MAKTETKNFVDLEALTMDAVELEALAMELWLNKLGEIRKREGIVGFGFRGRDHMMKLRKFTQLTHEVRNSVGGGMSEKEKGLVR